MRLVILGAGGHGRVVAEAARNIGRYEEIIFLDDHFVEGKCKYLSYGVDKTICLLSGKCEHYLNYIEENTHIYPAFGNNELRVKKQNEILDNGGILPTIIHPTAYVSENSKIEAGTVVLPKAIVNVGCVIKKACIINMGAIVEHGCRIDEGVHINSGAIVMAENHVPALYKVDAGTVIAQRKWPVDYL